ncbi:MAG TPA: M13 family metallopeptidase [Acidobacteriaceae bacterium]|jgi:endothelin-converting enzyme/putative endopeptidase|nr:M13 family metallopeptidase [Acidobacteriaceae bacterium]
MNIVRALLLSALTLTTLLAFAQTPATHGIDLTSIDRSVKPGDNFYLFANGLWMQRTTIPADRPSVGHFRELADRSDQQVLALALDAARSSAPNTDPRRIADLFESYMDLTAIEHAGLTPLQPTLDRIAALHNRKQLSAFLGSTLRADTDALNNTNFHTADIFGLWVAPGFQDSGHYAPYLMQGGTELPSRDYYLDASAHMQEIRAKYLTHLTTLFRLADRYAGSQQTDNPAQRAQRVLALETAIAKVQLSLADCENIHKANNLWRASDFRSKAPGLDWPSFFLAASLSTQKTLYVWQPSAIVGESALVASTPLDVWKDWLALHAIEDSAPYMSRSFDNQHFALFGTVLTGATAQRPRDIRAVRALNQYLGVAVGKLYAQRYFSPQAKADAEHLVANLLAVYHKRLEAITWMAPSTKAEALAKLSALQVSVGYPDTWRTYTGLDIRPDDLLGNIDRAKLFDYHYNLSRIGQPVNRREWCMNPQTVNAVNLPLDNALNFPAAILQPPFFDPNAPDAANYGAIGTVIGHEISHTFDTEGADFDAKGKVRDWWTPADFAHFNAATAALAAQFDTYEPLPGLHVNGRQTLGEDIADLGGVNASLDAWRAAEAGKTPPKFGGYTGEQQFFIAFAQVWATKTRDAALRRQLLTDPHAPGEIRALTVRNLDAWYKDFNVQPNQKLYLPPAQRIHIW